MFQPRDVIDEYNALGERFQRLPRWAAALLATMAGEIVRLRKMQPTVDPVYEAHMAKYARAPRATG